MTNKLLLLSGILAPLAGATGCAETQEPQSPNIIFILADDMGYGDLGCYGQQYISTPNIDKLASKGIKFTQHYTGCTVSAPSRSTLLTGQHTGHTSIRGNAERQPEGQEPLEAGTYTVAQMLKDAGYATGAFGKWGLGFPGSCGDPNMVGFDTFVGYNCQRVAHNYFPYHIWHNQERVILEGNKGDKYDDYAQDIIHDEAIKFIEENSDNPFFVYLPYVIPHAELKVPNDEILESYAGKLPAGKPYKGVDSPDVKSYKNGGYASVEEPRSVYAAMITRLDKYVGEVVTKLEELGIAENTIIIFASDNGPSAEGGADPKFFNSTASLRGGKRDMYEGGIRTPLIIYWPEVVTESRESDHISAFWDFMPTFADCAGIETPSNLDGISLYPTITNQGEQLEHEYLYWEFHEKGGKIAVRWGEWKGVKLNYGEAPDSDMELFNLKDDPFEKENIAAQNSEIVERIEEMIKSSRTESERFNFGRKIN